MTIPAPKRNQRNSGKYAFLCLVSLAAAVALFSAGFQQGKTARFVRTESKPSAVITVSFDATEENANWRGAPIGDGEDKVDSYHSYDHRPTGSDARDAVLLQYTIHPCPNNGIGKLVSGQDQRYIEITPPDNNLYSERNPKFLCDVAKLPDDSHQPCLIYSFGSWDEISFEVRFSSLIGYPSFRSSSKFYDTVLNRPTVALDPRLE